MVVVGDDRFHQCPHRFLVGDVALIGISTSGRNARFRLGRIEIGDRGRQFVCAAGDHVDVGAPFEAHPGCGLADATRPAGDQHVLTDERPARVVPAVSRRVEMGGPVLPQPGPVVVEIRKFDAARTQSCQGSCGTEVRRHSHAVEQCGWDALLFRDKIADRT